VLAVTATALMPPPASATVSRLCYGYTTCSQLGMSTAGYPQHNRTMYWRMYAGHNCTNYAAYRMVQRGMPNVRPWDGGGNATYWGAYMSRITDQTPKVGSIAWWRAGVYPAGSAGHVAYVERVVSPTEIIVSQDSWGGDFSWARITKTGSSSGWPSGFIHFNDVRMVNKARPTISGQAKVGSTLTATPGTWKPGAARTSYQWRAAGEDIPGADGSALLLTKAMLDKRIHVRVTASKAGFPSRTVGSERTEPVLPGVLRATTTPEVTGKPRVDSTLTAEPGTWSPAPDSVRYRWFADGEPVPGAAGTGLSLSVGADLVGKALALRVTARRAGYERVAITTDRTARVAPGVLDATGTPALTGTLRPGKTLRVSLPDVSPHATRSVQWMRNGRPIAGETEREYRLTTEDLGHRVRARVEWLRDGYTPLVLRSAKPAPVRTVPTLEVRLERGERRLRVHVTASAEGVDAVPAVVLVRARGSVLAEKALRQGTTSLRLTDLKPGTRRYRVVLPATDWTERVTVDRVVTIR